MVSQVAIKMTGFELDQAEAVRDLSTRLARYFLCPQNITWSCRRLPGRYSASCSLHARSGFYRATGVAKEPCVAVRGALEKVIRQRRRRKAALLRVRQR